MVKDVNKTYLHVLSKNNVAVGGYIEHLLDVLAIVWDRFPYLDDNQCTAFFKFVPIHRIFETLFVLRADSLEKMMPDLIKLMK